MCPLQLRGQNVSLATGTRVYQLFVSPGAVPLIDFGMVDYSLNFGPVLCQMLFAEDEVVLDLFRLQCIDFQSSQFFVAIDAIAYITHRIFQSFRFLIFAGGPAP